MVETFGLDILPLTPAPDFPFERLGLSSHPDIRTASKELIFSPNIGIELLTFTVVLAIKFEFLKISSAGFGRGSSRVSSASLMSDIPAHDNSDDGQGRSVTS